MIPRSVLTRHLSDACLACWLQVLPMTQSMPEFAGAVAIKHLRAIASGHAEACDVDGSGDWGWPPV